MSRPILDDGDWSARRESLDAEVRAMFQALCALPVPNRLKSVVDQLDEGEAAPPPRRRRAAAG